MSTSLTSNDVYRLIGINLGEDSIDGNRFTRAIKWNWLKLTHTKVETVISDAVRNSGDTTDIDEFLDTETPLFLLTQMLSNFTSNMQPTLVN